MGDISKTWYEKARVQFWYWSVAKLQGPNPDYSLDMQFAVRESLRPEQGKHRRRVFEWIRKSAREPRGGHPDMRTMAEIVEAVDAHPIFLGTARLYNSKLWELLSLKSITEEEILQRIDDVFTEFGIERFAMPQKEESWRTGRNPELDVGNPINLIELLRLQKANLNPANRQYLMLLTYLFSRTTVLAHSKVLLETFSHSLVSLFEDQNKDFGREYEPYLLGWIQSVEVVRVFNSNLN